MQWVKIGTEIVTHPRRLAVSLAAFGLWAAAIAYAGAHLTDGHVPRLAVGVLAVGEAPEDQQRYADELVAAGLWEARADGSYEVVNYLEWNTARADVEEAKAAAKRRKDRYKRKRSATSTAGRPGVASGDVPGTRSAPVPERVPNAARSEERREDQKRPPPEGEPAPARVRASDTREGPEGAEPRTPEARPGDPPAELVAAVLARLRAEPALEPVARPGLALTLAREGARRGHGEAAVLAAVSEAAGKESARPEGHGRRPAELAEFLVGCVRMGALTPPTTGGTGNAFQGDDTGTRSTLRLWSETYEGSTRRYGEYAVCRGDERVAGEVHTAAAAEVARHNERTGETWTVEGVLQHQFTRYLADGEAQLVEERHPLRRFAAVRSRYGFPWGTKKKTQAPLAELTDTPRRALALRPVPEAAKSGLGAVLDALGGPRSGPVSTAAPESTVREVASA